MTSLAESILIPLGLSTGISAADEAIQTKKLWIRHKSINNFKWRNRRYNKNS